MGDDISRRPRVVVAEDAAILRYTVKTIIQEECEAADGAAAVELRPDVVLLDISMPVMTGLEAARLIRERLPEVRVTVVSCHTAPAYSRRPIESVPAGSLLKTP